MNTHDPKKEIKCIVWDLDETVWDGILLENKRVKIKPGIKEIIRTLDSRGILHSVASKNDHNVAMEKLRALGLNKFFLYPEINWNAKSVSIERIRKNLNIGIDSMLFIDDQEFELDEVKSVHKDLHCLPAEEYPILPSMDILNPRFITEDSRRRRKMYMEEIKRKDKEDGYQGPDEEFLASLHMKFVISQAQEEDLKRAEELTIRTNQLNSTGRPYSYEELNYLRNSDDHMLLCCELSDKYGSYGKIGLALVEVTEDVYRIKLLLMSCRVMNRGVGSVLMSHIMKLALMNGKKLRADFKKTDRNRVMYISYRFANFKEIQSDKDGNILFENDLSSIQNDPPYIQVIDRSANGTD